MPKCTKTVVSGTQEKSLLFPANYSASQIFSEEKTCFAPRCALLPLVVGTPNSNAYVKLNRIFTLEIKKSWGLCYAHIHFLRSKFMVQANFFLKKLFNLYSSPLVLLMNWGKFLSFMSNLRSVVANSSFHSFGFFSNLSIVDIALSIRLGISPYFFNFLPSNVGSFDFNAKKISIKSLISPLSAEAANF